MQKKSKFTSIDRRTDITYKEFVEQYQKKGLPVILANITDAWADPKFCTAEYLRKNFGDRTGNHRNGKYTIAEMLDLTEKATVDNPAPYPVKFMVKSTLPEMMPHMQPLDLNIIRPNWLKSKLLKNKLGNGDMDLHIGGAGNSYEIHKDTYDVHAWLIQLYGEKEVICFPWDEEPLMYPRTGGLLESRSPIVFTNPDYEKYPNFKKATPIKGMLKAGEVLYIPGGMWHTTVAYRQNMSTIINQVNETNYNAWKRDVYVYKAFHNKLKGAIDYAAATVIGNVCRIGQLFGAKY
jgi:histone arginine demethylase JMJD6